MPTSTAAVVVGERRQRTRSSDDQVKRQLQGSASLRCLLVATLIDRLMRRDQVE